MCVLPAVVADSCAASIASRLRVVNFSAPNWLMGVGSPVVRFLDGRHPVCSSSGSTREKLSLFHSTLGDFLPPSIPGDASAGSGREHGQPGRRTGEREVEQGVDVEVLLDQVGEQLERASRRAANRTPDGRYDVPAAAAALRQPGLPEAVGLQAAVPHGPEHGAGRGTAEELLGTRPRVTRPWWIS